MIHLYGYKKHGLPFVTAALIIACALVTIPTYFIKDLWYVFAMQTRPHYFWQLFSGIFEHSNRPEWFLWVHFLGNMSFALTFGTLIERLLGSKKMLLLTLFAAVTHVLFFQLRFLGGYSMSSGASGIVYAYAPVALYIIVRYVRIMKPRLFKDPLFCLIAFEFLLAWAAITAVAPFSETTAYHIVATLTGLICLAMYTKSIDREIAHIHAGTAYEPYSNSKWLKLIWLMPAMLAVILLAYVLGGLNTMFLSPATISAHSSYADVAANGNSIVINFDRPVTHFGSVLTDGSDASSISYSDDGKTVYIVFPSGITEPYRAELNHARSLDGKIVRETLIVVGK